MHTELTPVYEYEGTPDHFWSFSLSASTHTQRTLGCSLVLLLLWALVIIITEKPRTKSQS